MILVLTSLGDTNWAMRSSGKIINGLGTQLEIHDVLQRKYMFL